MTYNYNCEYMIYKGTDGPSLCRSIEVVLLLLDGMLVVYKLFQMIQAIELGITCTSKASNSDRP